MAAQSATKRGMFKVQYSCKIFVLWHLLGHGCCTICLSDITQILQKIVFLDLAVAKSLQSTRMVTDNDDDDADDDDDDVDDYSL